MVKQFDPGPPRKMVVSDSINTLEATDIAKQAIDVANGAIEGTGANQAWEFKGSLEDQKLALAKYKAAIAALNAANGIVKTKVSIIKLCDLDAKAKKLRERGRKL